MLSFLKPTKQKIRGTVIVLIALFLVSQVNGAIANQLLPKELLTPDLESAITDIVKDDMKEFLGIGLKILAVSILVHISVIYLSMCLIFKDKGKM